MAQLFNIFNVDIVGLIFRIKVISLVLSIILGFLAVYFIVQFQKLVGIKVQMARALLKTPETALGGANPSKWQEITNHLESTREAEWKFSIIEADKLVDDTLKKAGYLGDTMGDRLTNIDKSQLLSLEGLWEAHKIRNKLVHDANYFLRYAEARQAIKLYEDVLRELQAI